ncbi:MULTISPECIES: hypothetical protein [unclassified Solwaraspora]|uniref:hypothetical protein n=1 Tax=unclassified Solwaraspora TaxID=2627926 RepID=UPI00259B699C|nr:hypothetical protein [Solwaraspora sp. WMMA2056]WJK42741.1 hypothetical protein O7608_10365 [Solwaraspora sp. WMMA2056]
MRTIVRVTGLPVIGCCLGLLAAQLVTQFTPPTYYASSSLVISAAPDQQSSGQGTASISLAQSLAPTIAKMAESREIAIDTADRLKLPSDAVVGQVTGRFEPGLQIVTVTAAAATGERSASIANAATESLIQRLSEFSIAQGVQIDARTLDRAAPPARPALPKPLLNDALGALAGLLSGLGLATARSRFDNHLSDSHTIEVRLGLPVLAVFPRLPRRFRQRHGRLLRHGPASTATETLLAGLDVFTESLSGRRILLTSVRNDDGKAMVAALLALRMASHSDRVTLAEGHPPGKATSPDGERLPTADRILFGLMKGGSGWSWGTPAPTVLASDPTDHRVYGRSGRDLLDDVDPRGDVVVHGPPILSGATATALVRKVDSVVLVVRRGSTDVAEAERAALLLRNLDVPFVGVVVVDGVDGMSRPAAWRSRHLDGPAEDHGRHRDSSTDSAVTAAGLGTPRPSGSRAERPKELAGFLPVGKLQK